MFGEEIAIATIITRRRRLPCPPALCNFLFADQHIEAALRQIEAHNIAGFQQCQRTADETLRCDMQDARPVGRAGHACIGNTQHVAVALFDQRLRDWQHAPFGKTGTAERTGIAQHQHMVGRHVEIFIVDGGFHFRVAVKHQCGTLMYMEFGIAGGRLDDGAVRAQIAAQHGKRAFRIDRIVKRADHVVIIDFCTLEVFAHAAACHGQHGTVETTFQLLHQRSETASVKEVLHQIVLARRADIGDEWRNAAKFVQFVQRHRHTGAARHGDEVDDGIGGAAGGHRNDGGVAESCRRQDLVWCQVFRHHLDNAAAAGGGHALMFGIDGRNGGGTRKGDAERVGNGRHGRGRAHRHAHTGRTGNAALHATPFLVRHIACAALIPIFPGVRTRAEDLAGIISAQHRAGRQIDHRHTGRDRTHDEARCRLVATAHQHHAVKRMRTDHFLRLHGQHVAVKHGRRLGEALIHREGRHFDREATRLQHAAFHVLHALRKVRVTGVEFRPGVEDTDDGFADKILLRITQLHHARAVAETAQVVGCKPAVGAEFFIGHVNGPALRVALKAISPAGASARSSYRRDGCVEAAPTCG
ncbi:Hypothetical protein AT6N2_L1701 [Agrobacterium tumefaciens]|nr:Hypothetical protein AT6N2_L1701 [Agrobacterium tumefaciens]